ncbi:hypothetical protein TL16_g10415 [Triparma laevis f. inornata]|uniref:Arsenite methyltransferase n=2 Tax=Triparma laevis TaxID=1534972 RepID=A0A9W7FDR8_9STRA|nr:hypothetical protein TL16_g10415 [Triparma laevis f. inornata]GMI10287.1 hypothetical protein TrLO_g6761 [Triparma laevis f. longispina]
MASPSSVKSSVSQYYTTLENTQSLKTNACETAAAPPGYIKKALKNVDRKVIEKYYGCGLCVPDLMEGTTVVDLGCGSGRDAYVISQLCGSTGKVFGVDMTPAQLEVARSALSHHSTISPPPSSIDFVESYIETFADDLKLDNNVDVVVSNCVINLSPDKEAVLRQAFKALKEGGELYFSDVYASRRVPENLRKDPVLWGECISGALYWNDFVNLAKKVGFGDPRLVSDAPITIKNKEIEAKCEGIEFYSATYRLFKLECLEPDCEDYGQAVIYKGTIPECPVAFTLDSHHRIEKGKVFPVCGNTWNMLQKTRFKDHFEYIGNFDNHYGIFDGCGKTIPYESAKGGEGGRAEGGGCC